MLKYRVTIPLPDGDTSISIWNWDMDNEPIWLKLFEVVKQEYGEYPRKAAIELIGDDVNA